MSAKTKKPRPSGVTVTRTKSGGFCMKTYGPNAPDLRTVVPGLLSEKPAAPSDSASPERLPFVQSDEWESRNYLGPNASQDIYSTSNCCYCYRKTRLDAQRLAMIRTHDGNWWLTAPTAPVCSDEWDRFSLPVGPDCLRNHPEWRFALTVESKP